MYPIITTALKTGEFPLTRVASCYYRFRDSMSYWCWILEHNFVTMLTQIRLYASAMSWCEDDKLQNTILWGAIRGTIHKTQSRIHELNMNLRIEREEHEIVMPSRTRWSRCRAMSNELCENAVMMMMLIPESDFPVALSHSCYCSSKGGAFIRVLNFSW